jgi:hypothetical protein
MLYSFKFLGRLTSNNNIADYLVQHAKGVLSNAQLLALHTTPVALVPAAGAGTYISVDEIVLTLNYGTIAFTGNNNMEFRYTDGSGAKVTGDAAYAWAQGTANAGVKAIAAAVTPVANAAVVAVVPTANWAAGDSTISYSIKYRVCTLP